jgi:hypothetical protein
MQNFGYLFSVLTYEGWNITASLNSQTELIATNEYENRFSSVKKIRIRKIPENQHIQW